MILHGELIMANSNIQLEEYIHEFRQEYGTCLDWIFKELKNPKNLGYSNRLIDLFKHDTNVMGGNSASPIISIIFWFWNGPKFFNKDARMIKKFENRIRTKKLALEYLPSSFIEIFPLKFNIKNAIYYKDFINCYFWLERLYYLSTERDLSFDDALNIYFSGIIERIILGLNNFDKFDITPEPDWEYFNNLRKLSIQKDAEIFKKKAGTIIEIAMKLNGFNDYTLFKEPENQFLDCLASFSAAKSDKNNISIEDYIIAYKTYYKLLKTDLKRYKCQQELFDDKYHGYIVCKDCGSFYELRRGETPDNFVSCHCKGNIEYLKYLKDDTIIKWNYVIIYSILLTLILVSMFKIYNLLYFSIIGIIFLILATSPISIKDEYDRRGIIFGSSIILTLSFLLSSLLIKSFFNDLENYIILILPMGLILTLDLIIILNNKN